MLKAPRLTVTAGLVLAVTTFHNHGEKVETVLSRMRANAPPVPPGGEARPPDRPPVRPPQGPPPGGAPGPGGQGPRPPQPGGTGPPTSGPPPDHHR